MRDGYEGCWQVDGTNGNGTGVLCVATPGAILGVAAVDIPRPACCGCHLSLPRLGVRLGSNPLMIQLLWGYL